MSPELYMANQERAILKRQLDSCRWELKEALQQSCNRKHARRMKKGRTFAMCPIAGGTGSGVPAYDPQHPHYDLNGYISRESFSDRETVETEESMVDNFKEAEPSRVISGQDDDGYAQELYTLRDEQLAQEKGNSAH